MKTSTLLFFISTSFCAASQTVKPVISPDYLSLIQADVTSKNNFQPDTLNSVKSSTVTSPYNYYGLVQKFAVRNNQLDFKPSKPRMLFISGNFNSFAEFRIVNRLPELQNQYAQGSSQNGRLSWRGPETDEMFSYGPAISELEFDGSNYDYDVNGRLVARGSGNNKPAVSYDNDIVKNACLFSRALSLQAKYKKGYSDFITTTLKFGKVNEDPMIPYGKNKSGNFFGSVELVTDPGKLTGSYRSQHNEISNPNRNGLLNRVYQNSLLTPISFSNSQGTKLAHDQRSYSQLADNPVFLLQDNSSGFREDQDIVAMGFEKRMSSLKIILNQSLEFSNLSHTEIYSPGTAFFEPGQISERDQKNRNYNLHAAGSYDFYHLLYRVDATAALIYNTTASETEIGYSRYSQYKYQRNSHDLSASFTSTYNGNNFEIWNRFENKCYVSNMNSEPDLFLPSITTSVTFRDLIEPGLKAKFTGSFNYFNSELPINQSFAPTSSLLVQSQDALQYFPAMEAQSFNHLKPIRNRDVSFKTELTYKYKLALKAELFQHRINDDVFPFIANDKLYLLNLASHKNTGLELELTWNRSMKNLNWNNGLSLTTYKSKVTDVYEGFNHLPFAGFGDINKTIVSGHSLGVIEGKAFLRDANQQVVIGNDGFPLVDPAKRIIADPNPDFVMKLWNAVTWRRLAFNMSWEWKKGGEQWNGTAAALDYYGRSKTTADYRNVTGYVFEGVTISGHPNTKPVSFYDPIMPVTDNRWTRNGFGGIDEEYIQKADWIRIDNASVSYKLKSRKYIQSILLSAYISNFLVWSPYKGGDPAQLFHDQSNSMGLDFFNLPSLKQFGFGVTLQF